jgi:hypothetical protein
LGKERELEQERELERELELEQEREQERELERELELEQERERERERELEQELEQEMIKLTAETVMRFVLVRSRMKALTKKEKLQADAIKEAMKFKELDELAPTASPFKLTLSECQRSQVDYEGIARKAYQEIYGREWREPFDKAVTSYGKRAVVSLEVEPNERYKPV